MEGSNNPKEAMIAINCFRKKLEPEYGQEGRK